MKIRLFFFCNNTFDDAMIQSIFMDQVSIPLRQRNYRILGEFFYTSSWIKSRARTKRFVRTICSFYVKFNDNLITIHAIQNALNYKFGIYHIWHTSFFISSVIEYSVRIYSEIIQQFWCSMVECCRKVEV